MMTASASVKEFMNVVEELRFDEIEQVDGGILPVLAVAYFGIGLSAAVLVAGYSWVAGVQTGYAVNKQ